MPQFLLTAEEYAALEPKAGANKVREDNKLMALMIAKLSRSVGRCIHVEDANGKRDHGYCDDCGLGQLDGPDRIKCPFPRNFSK